jgi:hypothetical protein
MKYQFQRRFTRWLVVHNLSLGAAADILGVSKLRGHLYLSGWFKFDPAREARISKRMDLYTICRFVWRYYPRKEVVDESYS